MVGDPGTANLAQMRPYELKDRALDMQTLITIIALLLPQTALAASGDAVYTIGSTYTLDADQKARLVDVVSATHPNAQTAAINVYACRHLIFEQLGDNDTPVVPQETRGEVDTDRLLASRRYACQAWDEKQVTAAQALQLELYGQLSNAVAGDGTVTRDLGIIAVNPEQAALVVNLLESLVGEPLSNRLWSLVCKRRSGMVLCDLMRVRITSPGSWLTDRASGAMKKFIGIAK